MTRARRAAAALAGTDLPQGSADGPGPEFTVDVPVRTPTARVAPSTDWTHRTVQAPGGVVSVTLHRDDPSPLVLVAEDPAPPPAVPEAPAAIFPPSFAAIGLGLWALRRRFRAPITTATCW